MFVSFTFGANYEQNSDLTNQEYLICLWVWYYKTKYAARMKLTKLFFLEWGLHIPEK